MNKWTTNLSNLQSTFNSAVSAAGAIKQSFNTASGGAAGPGNTGVSGSADGSEERGRAGGSSTGTAVPVPAEKQYLR